jgi:hypothetical protein
LRIAFMLSQILRTQRQQNLTRSMSFANFSLKKPCLSCIEREYDAERMHLKHAQMTVEK